MSDTENSTLKYFEEFTAKGPLNPETSFSVSLCSNSALLKDLKTEIQELKFDSKFMFVLKESKNTLFQTDEDLLRSCLSSLLNWVSFFVSGNDKIEVSTSNTDKKILFRINMPEKLVGDLRNLLDDPKKLPGGSPDNLVYLKAFSSSLTLLEKYFEMTDNFNEVNNHLLLSLPLKFREGDNNHNN